MYDLFVLNNFFSPKTNSELLRNFRSVHKSHKLTHYSNISIRLEIRYSCGRDSDLIRRETGILRDPYSV